MTTLSQGAGLTAIRRVKNVINGRVRVLG
jgi:hypothetical protein